MKVVARSPGELMDYRRIGGATGPKVRALCLGTMFTTNRRLVPGRAGRYCRRARCHPRSGRAGLVLGGSTDHRSWA
jgi:hypothetical protein